MQSPVFIQSIRSPRLLRVDVVFTFLSRQLQFIEPSAINVFHFIGPGISETCHSDTQENAGAGGSRTAGRTFESYLSLGVGI